jgi:hypothetical protein
MQCHTCRRESFGEHIIVIKLEDASKEHQFRLLECENCKLTQWYDHEREAQATPGNAPQNTNETVSARQCRSCNGTSHVSFMGTISKLFGFYEYEMSYEGTILFRICATCGLVGIYAVSLSPPIRAHVELKKRIHIADQFICPACNNTQPSETGNIGLTELMRGYPKYRNRVTTWFIFAVCKQCNHIAFFVN